MFGATGVEEAGVKLSFVTRRVTGKVYTERAKFNEDTQKNEKVQVPIEDPVIVFFPSGSVLLMSEKDAETKGFCEPPELLNIEQVNDTKTAAGKWKFAMSDDQRRKYWLIMENSVIRRCTSRGGYPLNAEVAKFSESSYLFPEPVAKKEKEAA